MNRTGPLAEAHPPEPETAPSDRDRRKSPVTLGIALRTSPGVTTPASIAIRCLPLPNMMRSIASGVLRLVSVNSAGRIEPVIHRPKNARLADMDVC